MIKRIDKYGATWCNPCLVLDKTLEAVFTYYPDIELVTYDVEEDEQKFSEMGIKNVPQLFFYDQDGVQVHRLIGKCPANKMKDIIDYHNRKKADYNPYNPEYVVNKQ